MSNTTAGSGDGSPAKDARRLDADLPTRDELQRLIAACSRRAPTGKRNAALIAVTRLCKKAGIERRIHPHACRHRMAVDLIQDGADLVTVQRLLGHSSASTTSIYLSRVGATEAVEFARNRDWTRT